eukprot:GILK01002064.1.p1 GENE.GILK01002064.1~~GILK01002064.1.p1  ORF type:complete len:304 (+),score=54.21 GILK01002064.1:73-984(+)
MGDDLRMTPRMLRKICQEKDLYDTPELNDKLYLHYKGFKKIENLDEYTGLKALWLECNGISKIEGLDKLSELRCLYLHSNCIERIENLGALSALVVLQLSHNRIRVAENLAGLTSLETLNLSHNCFQKVADVQGLTECPSITTLDLSDNHIEEHQGLLEILQQLPNLACLYLKGNPFVRNMTNYRKLLICHLPNLKYLDERPVFELERRTAEAWGRGGREMEIEERKRFQEEKEFADKRNMEEFRKLQDTTRLRTQMALDRIEREAQGAAAALGAVHIQQPVTDSIQHPVAAETEEIDLNQLD